jgi:hypothetical protein
MNGLPFHFEVNRGQTDERVAFVARAGGYTAFVMPGEVVLAVAAGSKRAQPPLRLSLAGADPAAAVRGREALAGRVHYFTGRDPRGWRTHVPTYGRVEVAGVYPGIDLVYYGAQRRLAFDAVVAPGADPSALRLAFEGAARVEIDARGDLVLDNGAGEFRLSRPVIYQTAEGGRTAVTGGYVLRPVEGSGGDHIWHPYQEVGVEVGAYDRSRPLVIDPVLAYSTYLGGSADEFGYDIAVDEAGQMYVTGPTLSLNFPTMNPLQPNFGGGVLDGDVFVSKLTADGSAFVYSTYFGGSSEDSGWGVAVDSLGSAYLTGRTSSDNFPLANPFQAICIKDFTGTCLEAFVTKLKPDGSALLYSTYLGGRTSDGGADIAVDNAGNAYIVGMTLSPDFATVQPLHGKKGSSSDGFITKINASGSALVYSTYLGGTGVDGVTNIAIDPAGNAYVTGNTESTDFPTFRALQPALAGGRDLFVAKLGPTGSVLHYSTYLGGSESEGAEGGIAVDAAGSAYVTAATRSRNFPTVNALQPKFRGGDSIGDAFVSKLDPTGAALVYSTYLGGLSDDSGRDIAVDADGFAHITGLTLSVDFPVVKPSQPNYGGGHRDAYVSKLLPTGSALVFSTFLGGTTDDAGSAIALGPKGNVFVAGKAETPGEFPTVNPLQPVIGGQNDAFVSRFTQTREAEIRIDPAIVPFGPVPVGGSRDMRFLVYNDGDAGLAVAQIAGIAPPITLLGPQPPFGVAPGERVAVWVRWRPTEVGPFH